MCGRGGAAHSPSKVMLIAMNMIVKITGPPIVGAGSVTAMCAVRIVPSRSRTAMGRSASSGPACARRVDQPRQGHELVGWPVMRILRVAEKDRRRHHHMNDGKRRHDDQRHLAADAIGQE